MKQPFDYKEYARKKRARAKENGVCQNCYKQPAETDKSCCTKCLEDKKLQQKFGSAAEYREVYAVLFEKQKGRCAICSNHIDRPVMDHCHETLEVRGLLCTGCNTGLGYFKDDISSLLTAVEYLRYSRTGLFFKKSTQKQSRSVLPERRVQPRPNRGGYIVLD